MEHKMANNIWNYRPAVFALLIAIGLSCVEQRDLPPPPADAYGSETKDRHVGPEVPELLVGDIEVKADLDAKGTVEVRDDLEVAVDVADVPGDAPTEALEITDLPGDLGEFEDMCAPDCADKQCGDDDGCGAICIVNTCDDDNNCNGLEECNLEGECVDGLEVDCDDGQWCNGEEICEVETGDCGAGEPPELDDGLECTVDWCDEDADEVTHAPDDTLCDDDNPCTTDSCLSDGEIPGCANDPVGDGPELLCDDGNPCTADGCSLGECANELLALQELTDGGCICSGDDDCVSLEDGNLCNGTLICVLSEAYGGISVCMVHAETVVECDDGLYCNGEETCQAETGECTAGEPPELNDDVECTVDECDEESDVVTHSSDDKECDDLDPCTSDSCDPDDDQAGDDGCVHVPTECTCETDEDCALLEDGDLCNGTLNCDSGLETPVCKIDPQTVMDHDDGAFCNGAEGCDPTTGDKLDGVPPEMDDGIDCTIDTCDEENDKVVHAPGDELCTDENVCTDDLCDPVNGCAHADNQGGCDDGNVCTIDDVCEAGACLGQPYDCDDENVCTDDSCEDLNGEANCVHAGNVEPCDAGPCTLDDTCLDGQCAPGLAKCDDAVDCTVDSCDLDSGDCTNLPDDPFCVDNDVCNGTEICDLLVGCQPGLPLDCDDQVDCTVDSCDAELGCIHTPDDGTCLDDTVCNGAELCDPETGCQDSAALVCEDDVPCTADSCDPLVGCQNDPMHEECDDGNPCIDDTCDNDLGCLYTPNDLPCEDDDLCTVDDLCDAGECQPGELDMICADYDHDGILNDDDACPYAFDPGNPDENGVAGADACEDLKAHGVLQHQRTLTLSQEGTHSSWRRTHEPVELPLANGIIDGSVLGYWKLDGEDIVDGFVKDYSLYANAGEVEGAVAEEGKIGGLTGALKFDGTAAVQIPSTPELDSVESLTVMAWVNMSSVADINTIVADWDFPNDNRRFRFEVNPEGHLRFMSSVDGIEGDNDIVGSTVLFPNTWYHVAATFDRPGTIASLYVDGRLDNTGPAPNGMHQSGLDWFIGVLNTTDVEHGMNGGIDEVVIFNRSLSPDEIEMYYRSGAAYGTKFVPGAQADFDDLRITEKTGDGDPSTELWAGGNETVKRSRVIGPRPHSDTPCPAKYAEVPVGDIPGIADREDLCGVAAYWKLEGDGEDLMGNYDGTAASESATAMAGRFGDAWGAMTFGGSGFSAPATGLLTGESWTVELWFHANDELKLCDGASPIFNKDKSGINKGDVEVYFSMAGACKISATVNAAATIQSDVGKEYWRAGNWHHLALVWSGDAFVMYVDGMPDGSTYSPPNPVDLPDNGAGLLFARDYNGNSFTGAFDDVLIHNVAKSPDYIYHRANPGVPTLRFLANTQVENAGDDQNPSYPLREYVLHWGDAWASAALPQVKSTDQSSTCYGLLNECLGYAGWWRFNNGRAVAVDSSLHKLNGTMSIPPNVAGVEGTAVLRDELVSGSANVKDSPYLHLDNGTIELAFRPNEPIVDEAGGALLYKMGGDPNTDNWTLQIQNSGLLVFTKNDSETQTGAWLVGDDTKWDNLLFYQAALLFGEGGLRMYVDHYKQLKTTAHYGGIAGVGSPLVLGFNFQGAVDSVRISNRAIAPDEFLHYPLMDWQLETGNWKLECGGTVCPEFEGYDGTCNDQDHCEYANKDKTGPNKWDVWLYVPPGSFMMGSPENEGGPEDERPVHPVTISQGYLIAKYEVVVEQYEACMADEPDKCTTPSTVGWNGNGWGTNYWEEGEDPADGNNVLHKRLDHPQNGLIWQQARDFCAWSAPGGRLPSEAEWEYAATGPVHTKYPWGDAPAPTCSNNTAVFNEDGGTAGFGCGEGGTWPVGSKTAGASWCGALDMGGNLWEWNEDWWHDGYTDAPDDGSAWGGMGTAHRVIRGGDFDYPEDRLRSSERNNYNKVSPYAGVGARCVRPAPATSCGGVLCPKLDGYFTTCNREGKCEYYSEKTTGHNKWDQWIYVPPGSFQMGRPEGEAGNEDELPVHNVTFSKGFLVGKYPGVVAQYEACEQAGNCSTASTVGGWGGNGWGANTSAEGRADHPQNGLNWYQANDYCAWVTPGGRLLSEAEWEYAASGPIHRKYPWGDAPEPTCDNGTAVFDEEGDSVRPWGCALCVEDGCSGTVPVGSRPKGRAWSGALDMSGNISEWLEDYYYFSGGYDGAPTDGGPALVPTNNVRVHRGGEFVSEASQMRTAQRRYNEPHKTSSGYGVRCVKPAPAAMCGGIDCPVVPGYVITCNRQDKCEYYRENTTGWRRWDAWVYVPPGSFDMGSPDSEDGHKGKESPVHTVNIGSGYFIGKYEVVVDQYEACMADQPDKCTIPLTTEWDGNGWGPNSSTNDRSDHPQNGLKWQQAKEFCGWVAAAGRLPSEAEWEYAATGPVHLKYPWGDGPEPTCLNETAVFNETGEEPAGYGCGTGGTGPVGSKPAGVSWSGAHDMSGNLWEWVEDCWHGDYKGVPPVDGAAWIVDCDDSTRVLRSGGFDHQAVVMRSAERHNSPEHVRIASFGARCARSTMDCYPDCLDKECGEDGCGGTCGECVPEHACSVGLCAPVGCEGELVFPDQALESVIRAAAGKPQGPLLYADIRNIGQLNGGSKKIASLVGIGCLDNLATLLLGGNQMQDLSPLGGLPELQVLHLSGNQFESIAVLKELSNIRELILSHNSQIKDLSPLQHLGKLEVLLMSSMQLSDVSIVSQLTTLQRLDLDNNQITDVSPLAPLIGLGHLDLSSNEVSDISMLGGLTELSWLALHGDSAEDLSVLVNFEGLYYLDINHNGASDLTPVQSLAELSHLQAMGNGISQLGPLSSLENLTDLRLSYNSIVDLSPLAGLAKLKTLTLGHNSISDADALSGLLELYTLGLDFNQLLDLSALVLNPGLAQGDNLSILNNPFDCQTQAANIAELEGRGVNVSSGCQ